MIGRAAVGSTPAPTLSERWGDSLPRLPHVDAPDGLSVPAGRFLLAPRDPENRLLPLPNAAWHVRMLATYGVLGAVVGFAASLAGQAGGDPAAIEGWFLLGGTIITVFKIAWFWGGAARHRGAFPGRLFG